MPSAPLIPLTLVGPGYGGLNKQFSSNLLPPEFSVEAQNAIFDDSGRLCSRKGWTSSTVTPISGTPDIEQLFEHKPLTGANNIISAANNKLYTGVSSFSDVTGAIVPTANNWKFVNFNGNCYGLQTSHALIQYTGAGNFTATVAASGTVPNGNELLGAFGRLWGTSSDAQTIKYSALLDATNWTTGAGSINLTSVWPTGADEIVALASFNAYLVVFGKRNIILFADGTGSALGINPSNIYVIDVVPGIGCVARDTVQNVNGDDLAFLSHAGVMTLQRTVQFKSNPRRDASKNVRDYLKTQVVAETPSKIRTVYNPREGLYLMLLPTVSKIFAFDTKAQLEDGAARVTEWNSFIPKSLLSLEDGTTLYCGKTGKIFTYSNWTDDGATYRFIYQSGWLDLAQQDDPQVQNRLKILKRLSSIIFVDGGANIIYKWAFDFSNTFNALTKSTISASGGAEWGSSGSSGEWGNPGKVQPAGTVDSEWGGNLGLAEFEIPGSGSGQFIKLGVEVDILGAQFCIQQLQLFAKVGRLT